MSRHHDRRHLCRYRQVLRRTLVLLCAAVPLLLLGAACSSSDSAGDDSDAAATDSTTADGGDAGNEAFTMSGPPSTDDVAAPSVQGPITTGAGNVVLAAPKFDLSTVGYVEEEFFISGDATSFTTDDPLTEDGEWTVRPDASAPYTSRVVVRRPASADAFSGTVVVEWLNVSGGLDADPDWTYTHAQIIRSGAAWVGVSAQRAGIEGGGNSLGAMLALKSADPERYGPLSHPGDDFSYDIYSQAGAAVWFESATLLGGAEPDLVLAMGESQSAFRLTTYVDAVAPVADVYDGYFVHSRAASGAPLAGEDSPTPRPAPDPTYSRTDLEVPVLVVSAETDLVGEGLGYGRARQDDTAYFASWEIAGTAHGDSYSLGIGDGDDGSGAADVALFDSMSTPPTSVYFGIIECDSAINTGPHTYVARAGLAALERWAREGVAPAAMPRLELDDSGDDFVRDEIGNAVGGIRTPQLDVPVATLSGLGQAGGSFCALFGTTTPLDAAQLAERYPDHTTFVAEFDAALERAVEAGAILGVDAEHVRAAAAASNIGG
jgi:hypothetical protein